MSLLLPFIYVLYSSFGYNENVVDIDFFDYKLDFVEVSYEHLKDLLPNSI